MSHGSSSIRNLGPEDPVTGERPPFSTPPYLPTYPIRMKGGNLHPHAASNPSEPPRVELQLLSLTCTQRHRGRPGRPLTVQPQIHAPSSHNPQKQTEKPRHSSSRALSSHLASSVSCSLPRELATRVHQYMHPLRRQISALQREWNSPYSEC